MTSTTICHAGRSVHVVTRAVVGMLGVSGGALALSISLSAQRDVGDVSMFAPLPLVAPAPPDNPTTPEKVALGRLLFWDPILSGAGDTACATCHHPNYGYADGRDLPVGVGGQGLGPKRGTHGTGPLVKRNSPTVLNVAFNGLVDPGVPADPATAPMFWDLRVKGLEAQALAPIESLEEMRGAHEGTGDGVTGAVARIAHVKEYQQLFTRAFGAPDSVTAANLARAIAAFERTLITADSPFDRYIRGDKTAIQGTALLGMTVFRDRGCMGCHKGPMFSDYQAHVLGVSDHPALREPDTGIDGSNAFRTPSLRNISLTAPYMHNGVVPYLSEAIGFYQRPGTNPRIARSELDPLLDRVSLSQLFDLVDFLLTLEGPFDRTIPRHVPSGLKPGGR